VSTVTTGFMLSLSRAICQIARYLVILRPADFLFTTTRQHFNELCPISRNNCI